MRKLTEKVVIITGGSRGIGKSIAELFAKQGARVVINYINNQEAAESTLKVVRSLGAEAILARADISTVEGRKKLVRSTIDEFGCIDILVNNAGIVHFDVSFLDYDEDRFDCVIDVNIKAPFFLSQLVAKEMVARGSGNIINISSVAGMRTSDYNIEAYELSKAALTMMGKSLANKLVKHGIRVNTISPGTTKTDINRENWEGDPEGWENAMSRIPLKRAGKPSEIAAAALYLASDDSAYTVAANIVIDGGLINQVSS